VIDAVVSFDGGSIVALVTLVTAIVGAVVAWFKVKPEAESIATRTTLEVIESLREQLKEARGEGEHLRSALRTRDEELESLQRRFATLRLDFDALEKELHALRGTSTPTP